MTNPTIATDRLAIEGGPKVCQSHRPARRLFGEEQLDAVRLVFEDAWQRGCDFGYGGSYSRLYAEKFCAFQGGGFAVPVCTGTAAVHVALAALDIPLGSDVIVSPVTNPGSVTPAIECGMNVIAADSAPGQFNVGPEQFERALTPATRAAILTHVGGIPLEMDPIMDIARAHNIKVVEDCSHAHGAMFKGRKVGTFGNIAAFSTMYKKTLATGGCGGIVHTRDEKLYWLARSRSIWGQDFRRADFDERNPSEFLFAAGNYNLDEISCAIGLSILPRLQAIIDRRCELLDVFNAAIADCDIATPIAKPPDCGLSPFFHTVALNLNALRKSKDDFTTALEAEGAWINPHYREVVCEWPWLSPYLKGRRETPNAIHFRDRTFNVLVHERFSHGDMRDAAACILKVARHYRR